jgi:TRAP-type C4-dicarboxylate transport system permease small subunit
VDALTGLVRFAAGLALGVASVVMLAQVVARFVFAAPFSWAEELAVLLFAWITFIGAAAVQRNDSHLSIDTLRGRLPPRARRALDVVRRVVIAGCCALLIYEGIALSVRMWPLEFPAMGVTRSLLYLSVPAGCVFSLLFVLRSRWTREPPASVESDANQAQ